MADYLAAQEVSSFPIGSFISNICSDLYQLIANAFANSREKNPNLELMINTWISGLDVLRHHGHYEWATFLQYGGEWERLRSINSDASRAWCPYILTRVLQADSNAYYQGKDHFISAWFEGIVEPSIVRQHELTTLLLNIDDQKPVLENSMFVKNDAGRYQISSEDLFEARPAMITRNSASPQGLTIDTLAHMGEQFDRLVQRGEIRAISTYKQTNLDYLRRMLSSMKAIYLELKHTESDDLVQYISLVQYVVGNVIQYCESLVREVDRTFKDLPVLDYFTNGETFPQPGSNEIAYAAQRLRGVARKDGRQPFSNATQSDIFWSIKSFLERSVTNNRIGEFVEFCVLAMCDEGDQSIAQHVRWLRSFVTREIFCEYMRIAREAPEMNNPVWTYVIACLTAVREVYLCVWETITAEDVFAINLLVEDTTAVVSAIFGVVDIIYESANMEVGLYRTACARMFDFLILADHIAYNLTEVSSLHGSLGCKTFSNR
jgi:hypothetical protein